MVPVSGFHVVASEGQAKVVVPVSGCFQRHARIADRQDPVSRCFFRIRLPVDDGQRAELLIDGSVPLWARHVVGAARSEHRSDE